jgi:putative membrane protein
MQTTNSLREYPAIQPPTGIPTLERVKAAVLLGLALYFAYNIASGNLNNYVNNRFAWLSYVAVALFALLGLANAIAQIRRQGPIMLAGRTPISWPMIAIAAIPLLLGTLVPSQPLGADAIRGPVSLSMGASSSASVFVKDPGERNVLDWLRVFSTSPVAADFDGEQATFTGFVYHEPDFPDDVIMVARFIVSCCVADAAPIALPVRWEEGEKPEIGEWVEVSGTFYSGIFRDSAMPILHLDSLDFVDVPQHPYLYP